MTPLDEIRLAGLRAFGNHGVFEQERLEGQEFLIDLVVRLPLASAASADDLARTVDYGELAERVVAAVQTDPVDLIETLAQRVADVALSFEAAREVVVTVHKPSAPLTVPFDDVSVTIVRRRPGADG